MKFWSVGRGDSTTIIYNNKKNVSIVDIFDSSVGKMYNYLDQAESIDFILLTHYHVDHFRGISKIISEFGDKIKKVFLPPEPLTSVKDVKYKKDLYEHTELYELEQFLRNSRVKLAELPCYTAGDDNIFFANNFFEMKIISPSCQDFPTINANLLQRKSYDLNINSLVVQFRNLSNNNMVLFCGDAPSGKFINSIESQMYSLIHISHHGSTNGNEENMLTKITESSKCIFSVKCNQHTHPNPKVIEKLLENRCEIFCTGRAGICGRPYLTGGVTDLSKIDECCGDITFDCANNTMHHNERVNKDCISPR